MSGNPYEAPVATEPSHEVPAARFRGRVIFVSLVSGMGGIAIVGGVFGLLRLAIWAVTGEPQYQRPSSLFREATTGGLIILNGCWLLWAAWIWWKGRWKIALAMCVSLYAVGVVSETMSGRL